MLTGFLMLIMAADQLQIVETSNVTTPNPEALVAELIKNRADTSSETFAERLIEAEGLTSWCDRDPISSGDGANLAWKVRHAANGREVVVYYSPTASTVCRISRERGGSSEVHNQAIRWCASSFGISLPATSPTAVSKN